MAKPRTRRFVPWALVALLALTAVLAIQAGPATAQGSTPTTSAGTTSGSTGPTTPPSTTTMGPATTTTASPSTGPNVDLPQCPYYQPTTNPTFEVVVDTPANNTSVSATVTIAGRVTPLAGAPSGTPHNEIWIRGMADNFVAEWDGWGNFSIPWVSDTGWFADGKYQIVVRAAVGGQVDQNFPRCIHLNNGFVAQVANHFTRADPYHVSQGELMYFYFDVEGEATFRPHTVLFTMYIDDAQVVTYQATAATYAMKSGRYWYDGAGSYAYRTYHSPGFHSVRVDLTLVGDDVRWTTHDDSATSFNVLHADYPSPTPVTTGTAYATTSTMGASASPVSPRTTVPPTTTTYDAEPASNAWIDPSALGLSSVRPQIGEPVTVYARIQNPLDEPVSGSVVIESLGPDGQPVFSQRENMDLGPKQHRIMQAAWVPDREGDHLVRALFVDDAPEGHHIPDGAISKARVYVGDGQTQTPVLVMSAGLINIGTMQEGETRTVPVEVTAYNQYLAGVRVLALDAGGVKVRSLTPPTDLAPGQSGRFYLQVEVPALGENETLGSQRLLVMARAESVSSNVESLSLVVHREGFAGLPFIDAQVALVAVAGTGAATAFFRRRGGNPPV